MSTTSKQKIGEILKKAIKGEDDGYHFYAALAQQAVNEGARRKLENLRDDELRHRATLYTLYDQHVGGEVGELPQEGINPLAKLFSNGHTLAKKSEMEYISLAIEAELAATRYYQTERNLIDDPTFRDIFDHLADEEHHHYELLQAEREALAGNYSWFGYDGTSPMED